MIRAILGIVAIGIIFFGLWLIASGFTESTPAKPPPSQVIATPTHSANPVALGTALLAGGVVFLIVVFRRR